MKEPWYIIAYEDNEHLHNKRLQYKKCICKSDQHEHCELCWARFSMHQSDIQYGYYEPDSQSWICPTCYTDHKDLFHWTVE